MLVVFAVHDQNHLCIPLPLARSGVMCAFVGFSELCRFGAPALQCICEFACVGRCCVLLCAAAHFHALWCTMYRCSIILCAGVHTSTVMHPCALVRTGVLFCMGCSGCTSLPYVFLCPVRMGGHYPFFVCTCRTCVHLVHRCTHALVCSWLRYL